MTSIESQFIAAINADAGQGDRVAEYVYAAWLDEIGDPRGEAWRVLLGEGKRPHHWREQKWEWWYSAGPHPHRLGLVLPNDDHLDLWLAEAFTNFHAAMNAAATAWVRCHRDPEFGPEMERVL